MVSLAVNLGHVTRNKKMSRKKKLKPTNASAHLVLYWFKIREGRPDETRKTTDERTCEEFVKEMLDRKLAPKPPSVTIILQFLFCNDKRTCIEWSKNNKK